MDSTLAESAAHGVPRKRGKLTLMDVSGARADEYRMEGNRVIVPISTEHGGIEGQESPFGPVVHRTLDAEFRTLTVDKEFRLDKHGNRIQKEAEQIPLEQQTARAEQELQAILATPSQMPAAQEHSADQSSNALLLQMVRENMELKRRLEQQLETKPPAAQRRVEDARVPVTFVGPWGKIAFRYKDVIQAPGCIILVGTSGDAQDYEPPVDMDCPYEEQLQGVKRDVVNPGLSFVHAGDKLSVLVVCQESPST